MNEYIVAALVIAVLLGGGFLLLINFGIAEVAYFGIGVIVLSILISILYTWWKTTSDKTIETLKIQTLSKSRGEFVRTNEYISKATDLVDVSDIKKELDALRDSLIKLGLYDNTFEKAGHKVGGYTLTFIEQHMRKTEQRLRSLETLTAGSYKPVLDDHLRSLLKQLQELKTAGFRIELSVRDFEGLSARPAKNLREMIDKEKRGNELFISVITECINSVEALFKLAKGYGEVGKIEEDIQNARKNIGNKDACVPLLIKSRTALKEILAKTFALRRARLLSSIEKVLSVLVDEVAEFNRPIQGMKESISSMDDPGRLNELLAIESNFKNNLASLLTELSGGLTRMESEILIHDPKEDFWNRTEGIRELLDRVDASKDLDDFMADTHVALETVTRQYRKDVMFKKVLDNYRKIEPIISKRLEEKGKLEESDINVKYADKFMHFYSSKHPDVEFRKNPPTLISKAMVAAELKDKLRRR